MFVVLHKIRLMLELHDGLKDQGPAPHPQQTHRILRVHKHTAYKTHTYGTAHSLQAEQTDQRYTHNNTALQVNKQYHLEIQITYLHLSRPRKAK